MYILPSYMITYHYVSGYKPDYVKGKTSGLELKLVDTVIHSPSIENVLLKKDNDIPTEFSILGKMNTIEDFLLIQKLKKKREE